MWRGGEQLIKHGSGHEKVLEAVQQEQHPARAELIDQAMRRRHVSAGAR